MRRILIAAAALTATVTGLNAQSPERLRAHGISPEFARFLQSQFNRDAINQVIRGQVGRLPGACTDVAIDTKFNVNVFAPATFSPDGLKLTAGAWKEFAQ